jgi:hypothetical protein
LSGLDDRHALAGAGIPAHPAAALSTISFNVIATLPSSMANCRLSARVRAASDPMGKLNDHDERHLVSQSHADWVSRLVETRESMPCAETKSPASLRWRVAV